MADWNAQIIEEFRANGGTVTTNGFGRGAGARAQPRREVGSGTHQPGGEHPRSRTVSRLIAASAAGADKNPAWYHNLIAHPDVTIETPDGVEQVHVTELEGAERDAGWAQFTAMSAGFRGYEEKTDRIIPVLRLSPMR